MSPQYSRPLDVLIIGSGPAGLVTGKTLLHPPSSVSSTTPTPLFNPQIFTPHLASPSPLGGLWAPSSLPTMRPSMRVNHSHWGCMFSDTPHPASTGDFPTAPEMGAYLSSYAQKWGVDKIVRYGRKVVDVEYLPQGDGEGRVWCVQYDQVPLDGGEEGEGNSSIRRVGWEMAWFDKIVVCSGFFARPWMPGEEDVPGLDVFSEREEGVKRVVHSSEWREVFRQEEVTAGDTETLETVLVVGGLISGVEIASELALLNHAGGSGGKKMRRKRIVHVFPRPPWVLPLYLPAPQGSPSSTTTPSPPQPSPSPAFLPVDFLLYNAFNLPPPPGPSDPPPPPPPAPETLNQKINTFVKILAGHGDQSSLHENLHITQERMSFPTTTSISDTYANAVRSGEIEIVIGYLESLTATGGQTQPSTTAVISNDQKIENVDKIVFATGYRPDLGFFAPDLKKEMGILEGGGKEECFLPVPLWEHMLHPALITYPTDPSSTTEKPTVHGTFVGMYKGPYFGVLEQQALYTAYLFSSSLPPPPLHELNAAISALEEVREKRLSGDGPKREDRAQWSTTGFLRNMDTLQQLLGVEPAKRGAENARRMARERGWGVATVVPAHYVPDPVAEGNQGAVEALRRFAEYMDGVFGIQREGAAWVGDGGGLGGGDGGKRGASGTREQNVSRAVFRSLHGEWDVNRNVVSRRDDTPSGRFIGKARFIPRKPTFIVERDSESGGLSWSPLPSPDEMQPNRVPETGIEEYLYAEYGTFTLRPQFGYGDGFSFPAVRKYIYRFDPGVGISVWFVKPASKTIPSSTPPPLEEAYREEGEVDYLFHEVEFFDSTVSGGEGGGSAVARVNSTRTQPPQPPLPGQWLAKAREKHLCEKDLYSPRYRFEFGDEEGRGTVGAEVREMEIGYDVVGPKKDYSSWGRYTRGIARARAVS